MEKNTVEPVVMRLTISKLSERRPKLSRCFRYLHAVCTDMDSLNSDMPASGLLMTWNEVRSEPSRN
jgi:hypothetical protein